MTADSRYAIILRNIKKDTLKMPQIDIYGYESLTNLKKCTLLDTGLDK
jgi:hypothetical protein